MHLPAFKYDEGCLAMHGIVRPASNKLKKSICASHEDAEIRNGHSTNVQLKFPGVQKLRGCEWYIMPCSTCPIQIIDHESCEDYQCQDLGHNAGHDQDISRHSMLRCIPHIPSERTTDSQQRQTDHIHGDEHPSVHWWWKNARGCAEGQRDMLKGCVYGCCQEARREAETADGQRESDIVVWVVVQHHTSSISSDFSCTAKREQICEEVSSFPDPQAGVDDGKAGEAGEQEDIDSQVRMIPIDAFLHWATWSDRYTAGVEEAYSANHDRIKGIKNMRARLETPGRKVNSSKRTS